MESFDEGQLVNLGAVLNARRADICRRNDLEQKRKQYESEREPDGSCGSWISS